MAWQFEADEIAVANTAPLATDKLFADETVSVEINQRTMVVIRECEIA